jgi:predicted dehydrogenase
LETALSDKPYAVVVANPSSLHLKVAAAALRAGSNVLLEKPVCSDLVEARDFWLQSKSFPCACSMAYCFRYHPLYKAARDASHSGRLGRVFHVRAWQFSYLPNWHTWEDYRISYAARPDLGGGVIRTLDHELDILRWVLGQPYEVLASSGTLSGLELAVEDTADMIFRFDDRRQGSVHVSFARRDAGRGISITGEDGSAVVDWNAGTFVETRNGEVVSQISLPTGFELNSIYVDMMNDALRGFADSPPRAAIPLADGVATLDMATGALTSSKLGKAVRLGVSNNEPSLETIST